MEEHDTTEARVRSAYAATGGAPSVFSSRVADYVASRPGYPSELFQELVGFCPPGPNVIVADVGAGTGLLTRSLLEKGYRVVAVEPNAEMRQAMDNLLWGKAHYSSMDGHAEELPLDSGSIDLITAAQAFHWFDVDRSRAEWLRVLKPNGLVALIWNDRVFEDPLHAAFDELAAEFGGEKRAALAAYEKERSGVQRLFGATHLKEFCWPYVQHLDESGLLALVFSRSYIPARTTPEGIAVANRIRELFRRFAVNGTIEVRYNTTAVIGRPS